MSKLPNTTDLTDNLPSREDIRRRVRERRGKAPVGDKVPGPTPNPASNLLIADITMRFGTYLLRGGVEKLLLTNRYGKETAENIVENRSMLKTVSAVALAKAASKSKVASVVLGTGIVGKVLYDRSKSRRANKRQGDAQLLGRAYEDG
ncbi:hypothetical protein [Aurantiacibacter poecillastricola]|uniref:hypothetical protein n=1 Tax=Aurantiacibacter poecillastricola TaxID=3064385 RepID=UPI00273E2E51|nr:hypothetical protein [Aurantiacibacter sp. 219JJ12-13]MDP5263480.1 hypothetical protein [Aurantiacibacter sp. 219JJ12-13]